VPRQDFKAGLKEALIPAILIVVLPTTVLGFLLSGSRSIVALAYAVVLIVLADMSANVINNYSDWEIDIANRKRNALHRSLRRKHLVWIYLLMLLAILAVLVFSKANIYLWISTGLFVLLGFSYSLNVKLKDLPILNYLAIAIAYAALASAIGFFSGGPNISGFLRWSPLFIFLVLIDFGYSMTKDYSDVVGDKSHNKRTLPVLLGKSKSLKIQATVITVAYVYLFLLVIFGVLAPVFLVLLISYAIAVYTLVVIYRTTNKETHNKMHYYSQRNGFLVRLIIIIIVILLLLSVV